MQKSFKSFKINGDLIESSGEKLKKVGYLMIGGIVLYVFNVLVITNSRDIDDIQSMTVMTLVVSIILTIAIIYNIIKSGEGFVNSVQTYYEDGLWESYHENGKLEMRGTYKDGEKDGIWESYYDNGELEWKRTYKDGSNIG
jgi:hypothetical protein